MDELLSVSEEESQLRQQLSSYITKLSTLEAQHKTQSRLLNEKHKLMSNLVSIIVIYYSLTFLSYPPPPSTLNGWASPVCPLRAFCISSDFWIDWFFHVYMFIPCVCLSHEAEMPSDMGGVESQATPKPESVNMMSVFWFWASQVRNGQCILTTRDHPEVRSSFVLYYIVLLCILWLDIKYIWYDVFCRRQPLRNSSITLRRIRIHLYLTILNKSLSYRRDVTR